MKKKDTLRIRRKCVSGLTAMVVFSALLTSSFYSAAFAETRIVTSDADSGAGSLRQAVADSLAGDTISFAPELNGKTIVLSSSGLQISKNISIAGPGPANLSISGNSYNRVFFITPSITATISGLTIINGSATRAEYGGVGGGIFNRGTLTLDNVSITGCTATFSGGGITNQLGTLYIKNSSILNNSVTDNQSGSYGGGIDNYSGTVDMIGTTFANNSAYSGGGAIRNNYGGTMTIAESTIDSNTAEMGGGIFNTGNFTKSGVLTITASLLSNNTARKGAGIYNYAMDPASVSLVNTTISGNKAIEDGGGIFNLATSGSASIDASWCTITGNNAVRGAGIMNSSSHTGIYASISIKASILAGNNGKDCFATGDSSNITSTGYNLTGNATGCPAGVTGDITTTDVASVLLPEAVAYGGPTKTHSLVSDSAALDTIPKGAAGCGDAVIKDQRGETRPQGLNCDMGAFEQSFRTDLTFTFELADAMLAYQIYLGKVSPTLVNFVKLDVAPLGANGTPEGNRVIDDGDVMLILRRIVGIW